ncbi:MAG: ribosomal protein [Nitrososphaeraceae archaeon]|jgi:large subunit ribosomal protein L18|nr:ribosomal protein [Nitrososphaeraceae archaeon]
MAYVHTLKRIRQRKTNYRKRSGILIGRRPFIITKISGQNISAQALKPTLTGDIVIASAHSRELIRHGWKGSMNSMPACYLTGLLLGKKSIQKGATNAVLYTGNNPFTTKVAACLKGIVDSGINIPVSKESLPGDDRVSGEHIANYANLLKDSEEKYNSRFSALLKQGLRPEDYPVHFEEIRMKISGKSASEDKKLNESDLQVNKLSKEEFNNTTMNKPKSSSKGGNKKE